MYSLSLVASGHRPYIYTQPRPQICLLGAFEHRPYIYTQPRPQICLLGVVGLVVGGVEEVGVVLGLVVGVVGVVGEEGVVGFVVGGVGEVGVVLGLEFEIGLWVG